MKKLMVQAFCFFGISGIGWLIDMTIYTILTSFNLIPLMANMISSMISVTFVYLVSTRKMFVNHNQDLSLKKKYIFYIIYQICSILLFSAIINSISNMLLATSINVLINYHKICAKIIVTPITMVLNFIFMKILIEKI